MQKHCDGGGKGTEDQQQVDVSDLFFVSSIEETHVIEEETDVMLSPDVENLGDHRDNKVEPSIRWSFVLLRPLQRVTKTGFRPHLTQDVRQEHDHIVDDDRSVDVPKEEIRIVQPLEEK